MSGCPSCRTRCPRCLVRPSSTTNPPWMTICCVVSAGRGVTHALVVPGATGSGKTTMLNVLGAAIPSTDRVVVVEDAAELQLPGPHVVRLEARPPNVEGRGEVPMRELVRNAFLQAANTGHRGLLTTLHAGG